MVMNSTNINKTNNHLLTELVEQKKRLWHMTPVTLADIGYTVYILVLLLLKL
jgi:hypothetical protein